MRKASFRLLFKDNSSIDTTLTMKCLVPSFAMRAHTVFPRHFGSFRDALLSNNASFYHKRRLLKVFWRIESSYNDVTNKMMRHLNRRT